MDYSPSNQKRELVLKHEGASAKEQRFGHADHSTASTPCAHVMMDGSSTCHGLVTSTQTDSTSVLTFSTSNIPVLPFPRE